MSSSNPSSDNWWTGPMVAFDLETTSADPFTARIVTANRIIVQSAEFGKSTSWIVNPGIEVPSEAAAIHGYTTEKVRLLGREAPGAIQEIGHSIAEHPTWPLIIFNANYDLTVLTEELKRYGLPPLAISPVVVDPFVIDRHLDKYRKGSRKLVDVCNHYNIPLPDAHDAAADALAAARLCWRLAQKFEGLRIPLATLFQLQKEWHIARTLSYAEYLKSQGKPSDNLDLEWPLRFTSTPSLPLGDHPNGL